jgi:hypothetical protein
MMMMMKMKGLLMAMVMIATPVMGIDVRNFARAFAVMSARSFVPSVRV